MGSAHHAGGGAGVHAAGFGVGGGGSGYARGGDGAEGGGVEGVVYARGEWGKEAVYGV